MDLLSGLLCLLLFLTWWHWLSQLYDIPLSLLHVLLLLRLGHKLLLLLLLRDLHMLSEELRKLFMLCLVHLYRAGTREVRSRCADTALPSVWVSGEGEGVRSS